MGVDDRELVARCLADDQEACAALVDAYARLVGTVIWRALGDREPVEDLVQETFLRAFRGLRYFRADAKLSTWLCTIAHRIAIDHRRKSGHGWHADWFVSLDDPDARPADTPVSPAPNPESSAAQKEVHGAVRAALARLPAKYRVPLVYATIDGLDYPTIASMLGVPVGTVKTLVFRGRRMLKQDVLAALGIRTDGATVSDAI